MLRKLYRFELSVADIVGTFGAPPRGCVAGQKIWVKSVAVLPRVWAKNLFREGRKPCALMVSGIGPW